MNASDLGDLKRSHRRAPWAMGAVGERDPSRRFERATLSSNQGENTKGAKGAHATCIKGKD
eukprot:scaffold93455_cov36-Tisochrysis_lutea.AAC.4